MARTITPTYRVETRCAGYSSRQNFILSGMEWRVKNRAGNPGFGLPNEKNLHKFIERMNDSMQPGGVNAHIRDQDPSFKIVAARVVRQRDDEIVAEVGSISPTIFEIL